MLKIPTFKASCSQTIINIVVKVVVRSFVSTSYVCNYLHGLSENNRKCCFPIVVSYSPLSITYSEPKKACTVSVIGIIKISLLIVVPIKVERAIVAAACTLAYHGTEYGKDAIKADRIRASNVLM